LEECLYGVLVVSANEVANAIAEYVSGDIDSFVELMNKRAQELGCVDSHFNNPHGYSDPDHYTSAYDLAMIGKEFFDNELLSRISRTPTYHWYPTDYQPDDIVLGSTNYFMKGRKYCEGLIGSKTGFTDESRQCLVTACQRNGLKLICVVMSEETPYQYDDTLTLFNYGFSNFDLLKVSDYETRYTITKESFFHSDSDVFGNSDDFLVLDDVSKIIVPSTLSFADLDSKVDYSNSQDNILATVKYSYNNVYLGSASLLFVTDDDDVFTFDENYIETDETEEEPTFIYINHIIYGIISIAVLFIVITFLHKILSNFHFGGVSSRRSSKRRRRRKSKYTVDKKRMKQKKPSRSTNYIDFK
ncbi:MAG: D-alanyl-D-alanine carboxypeptidase, partial [Firmicutes bacterium]|nr:D-alanyl-D-alanine carboxypeptidase [Candidatus Colivicinus equi]